jgi:hypothetical protein
MKRQFAFLVATVVASVALLSAPSPALADATFYGTVIHVSMNSIKVQDMRSQQTLAFEILPHFDQIFSADGKTTYQMKRIHGGSYVCIVYDQHALGMRHADKVYVLDRANQRISQP